MTSMLALLAAIAIATASCSDDGDGKGDAGTDTDTDADTDTDVDTDSDTDADGGDECVETVSGTFPAEAVELAWEPAGAYDATFLDFGWSPIEGYEGTYTIGEEPMWTSVRFNIDAPATIYGARVQWGNLDDVERPAVLGAYEDFGSNGFDFWQWDALWEGTRCVTADDEGAWLDYVFDEPIEMDLPGYFFVANFFEDPAQPLPAMTSASHAECTAFDDCTSAINMPGADDSFYYNGITFIFQYDFAMTLLVELHDTIPAEDKWFQIDDALSASSRVAWGDYDDDGDDDLMTNGPTLYRNEGDGSFTDVTADAGLTAVGASTNGGVFGDYDNDGCLDYFGQNGGYTGPEVLLHSDCDGTFTDVTATSGINDLQDEVDCVTDVTDETSPTEGSAWVDLDNDGFLDLYLAEHICWDLEQFYIDRIWHNEGDGTFTDWTEGHGFAFGTQRAGRGVSPLDFDFDGDVDIFVSNYRLNANWFYENLGDGDFSDVAWLDGLAGYEASGYYGHTIGAAWGDFDNDGDFDLLESNLAHPRFYHFSDKTLLMLNDGSGNFEDNAAAAGIHYRETHSNPTVADFDLDGSWDLFITAVYDGRFSEMYLNDGTGNFQQVNYESGAIIHNGWGSAASDYDQDGDVDLVAYDLFRNDSAAIGSWLQVRTLGGETGYGTVNAAGIGAVVRVTAGDLELLSHTSGGSGTGCQDSLFLTFGLGTELEVYQIEVYYPGGATVTVDGPIAANQRVWIQADGTVTYGWTPPM